MKARRVWVCSQGDHARILVTPQCVCLKHMDDPLLPLKVKNPEEEEEEEGEHFL